MQAKPKIVELDFGMGNIRSLQKAFEHFDQPVQISSDADSLKKADAVLLPGDGAFGRAMSELHRLELYEAVKDFYASGRPLLGICIGFQILFSGSSEFGNHRGFEFLNGRLDRFSSEGLTVPHMGWSETEFTRQGRLNKGIDSRAFFYYVHSYRLDGVHEDASARCQYGTDFTAVIEKDNLFGTQFHPEKSQKWGLQIIQNFIELLG